MKSAWIAAVWLASTMLAEAVTPCRIEVVEQGTDWPVPLVELRTTSDVRFVTDNAGVVAFDLPECMGRETWLSVEGHGYELPADGLGNRGVRFVPTPGGTKRIEIKRVNVARRLGRLTGAGIFGESQKLGERLDWKESGVVGSDTVQAAPYKGRLFWAWGDTGIFGYPLGIFNASGATTPWQPISSFQPPLALPYEYFRNVKGAPRGVEDIPHSGPVWVSAMVTLPDHNGGEHLVCRYAKIRGYLEEAEIGLAEWDDASASFKVLSVIWKKADGAARPPIPVGHAAFWQDPAGQRWVYFGEGLPRLRCPATYEDWKNPATWQPVKSTEHLLSAANGETIAIASGGVAWNAWRQRWVAVVQQKFGKASPMGEVWYAEAAQPGGPWGPAVRVLTHHNYTFYNVTLHPELTRADSPMLLFEGTYTAEFSNHPVPTPRYNYNQMLYRLDLDDAALTPAHGGETKTP